MKKRKKKSQTSGEALVAIAEASPDALLATAQYVEQSKDEVIALLEDQLEAEISRHAETQRKLDRLNRDLTQIRGRILWLLGDPLPTETIDDIEEELEGRPE